MSSMLHLIDTSAQKINPEWNHSFMDGLINFISSLFHGVLFPPPFFFRTALNKEMCEGVWWTPHWTWILWWWSHVLMHLRHILMCDGHNIGFSGTNPCIFPLILILLGIYEAKMYIFGYSTTIWEGVTSKFGRPIQLSMLYLDALC